MVINFRLNLQQNIIHDISYNRNALSKRFISCIPLSGLCWAKQTIGKMIRDYPIDLFRHCPVKAPQSCFNMCDWYMELCRSQCPGQRRVSIAVDYNPIWPLLHEHLLNCLEHTSSLTSMRSGTNS